MALQPAEILSILTPLLYLAGALTSRLADGPRSASLAALSAAAALAAALAACAALALGPVRTPAPLNTVVFFDALSAVILGLIAFVGFLVVRFSGNYLGGNPRQPAFMAWLCATLACVSALVVAGDLRLFVIAWIATSLSLHRLLLFYSERPRAVIAARKKFVSARIGDAALIAAAAMLANAFETTSIGGVLEAARAAPAGDAASGLPALAPFLIAVAALLKSAQFPTHGWLIEVMETPTPVSALLHAGIVNAGGFLVIRFADVMLLNAPSMHALALIGGFSALFGSIVMLTQTSIKTSLAYSTVAQMGFMLLQCGLGAFTAATLHIVAHSLYKAHAFLSSGRAVSLAAIPRPALSTSKKDAAIAFAASMAIYFAVGGLFGGWAGEQPAILALGAVFTVGLAMYLSALLATPAGRIVGLGLAGGAAASYFILQNLFAGLLRGAAPEPGAPDGFGWAVIVLATLSFAAVALAQIYQLPMFAELRARFYVHAANGFYANAFFNRMVGALRVRSARVI